MKTKISLAIAAAISVGGCTYMHSYLTQNDFADANAYCEQRRADPAIKPVAGKLPIISTDEINPEMLTLEATPTDAEVDAIKALSRDQTACRQRLRAVTQERQPATLATLDEFNMKLDLTTAELLQKKMSYGNANRAYRQAALEASAKFSELAKDAQADADEREATTWRSLGQTLVGAAKPPSPRADKSCSWIDSSTDCNRH